MIRDKIKAVTDWLEDSLRSLCGSMSAERRLVVLLALFILFAALSLYVTASAFYNLGKDAGERIQIRHIEGLMQEREGQDEGRVEHVKQLNDGIEKTTE